ncbi:MAG: DUF5711 family protein [Hominilimicola sp.]
MKKDDDFINENSINDLIRYAEEEGDTPEETYEEDTDTYADKQADEENIEEETEEIYEEVIEEKPAMQDISEEVTPQEENVSEDYLYYETEDESGEIVFEEDKKNTKKGIIIGVAVGILAVIAFITIDSGIIGNYKNNFANNFSRIFANFKADKQIEEIKPTPKPDAQYNTEVSGSVIVSLGDVNDTEFEPYNNGILCASMNHLSFVDSEGSTVWEMDTAIVDPILDVKGSYILLAEKGRSKICLYNDKKLVYDVDDPDSIMAAKVSSSGDVIAVTDKSSYKGGISVYNKSGAQIFSWASGSDTVISADISSASRRVAVSLLNTDTTAKSIIQLFDVNKTESYAKVDIDDTVVFDMEFTGDTLSAFGDNRIVGISSGGNLIYDNTFENVQLTHSAIDGEGNKLLSFDDNNIPMLNMYGKKGLLKASATLTGVTDFIDINGRDILYNIGRDVYFGRINSKNMTKYTATMDIKDLLIISDNTFVIVYSNSFEVVNI